MDNRVLTLRMEDGRVITAPTGIWFLALWDVMNQEEKSKLFGRMELIRDNQLRKMNDADRQKMMGKDPYSRGYASVPEPKRYYRSGDKSFWNGTDEEFLKSMMIEPF